MEVKIRYFISYFLLRIHFREDFRCLDLDKKYHNLRSQAHLGQTIRKLSKDRGSGSIRCQKTGLKEWPHRYAGGNIFKLAFSFSFFFLFFFSFVF
jgi:hypothetical protein